MPTSLKYFSNKYRCHRQFAQHKSSCALQTCGQSISICHVIVLNTWSVLVNVWRLFFKGNIPNLFRGIYFTLATLASFYRAGLFSIIYLGCHVETMEWYAQQNTFIHIETAPSISIYQFGDKGVGTFKMSIASPGEWRGMVAQEKKKKIRNRWVSLWADTKWFQEQQKLSLPKSKEGKPRRTFLTCVALKCEYQRVSNAESKTRYNCKRLSQPINIKTVRVRLDHSLHALVPRINCRDVASARGHFTFKYLRNTTEIRGTTWNQHSIWIWPSSKSTGNEQHTDPVTQIHERNIKSTIWIKLVWLHMERCPGEWWVINDRARMAGVCLWLTWFDPKCLVTMAIGQSCSLWMAVRIPGAIRWSAWWAWVDGEVGEEEEEVQNEGSNGYNYTQQQREVLVLPLLHDLRALGPPPPYLVHWFPKPDPPSPVGGTTILLHCRTQRSTGNWAHRSKLREISESQGRAFVNSLSDPETRHMILCSC